MIRFSLHADERTLLWAPLNVDLLPRPGFPGLARSVVAHPAPLSQCNVLCLLGGCDPIAFGAWLC